MAITYAGYCNATTGAGTGTGVFNSSNETDWATSGYACPGTGAQTLKLIGVNTSESSSNYIRMALYQAGSLIVYATTKKHPAADGWLDWITTEVTWASGTTLTGGLVYHVLASFGGASNVRGDSGRPAGTYTYNSSNYTDSGFPASLPAGSLYTYEMNVRFGVEPAGGGGGSVTAKGVVPVVLSIGLMGNGR